MLQYSERYGFEADPSSLRYREMRSERAAKFAEEKLHEFLLEYDLISLEWEAKVGRGQSRELFDLGGSDYASVAWLVGELLDVIVATMPTDPQLIAIEMAEFARFKADYFRQEAARKAQGHDEDVPF
jgi:hypothetical protein